MDLSGRHHKGGMEVGANVSGAQDLIVVIDDDPLVRVSLDRLFRSVGYKVAVFGSAAEFLDMRPVPKCGCIVLDVRLPAISGLDFQRQLSALDIRVPIVFMTGYGDISMSVRAMKEGAVDFLVKPFRDQDLLDAVAAAIECGRNIREEEATVAELDRRLDKLTVREREVMIHVVAGLMNKQIAHLLGLSEITVKIHRGNVMKKMDARSVPDLVRMHQILKAGPVSRTVSEPRFSKVSIEK